MRRKQITFTNNCMRDCYKPKVGELVYIVESQTMWKFDEPYLGIKAGDSSKPGFVLSKNCPVSNRGVEIEEGWLGAFCADRTQTDSWSLGKWCVTKIADDLPLTKTEQYECESKFRVYLTKVK
jgi:hypothetical protein